MSVCPQSCGGVGGLLQTEEQGGCDYGFCVCAVEMMKVRAGGEAAGIQGGETGSWMHALENMTSDLSQKSFGLVSQHREQWCCENGGPSITPFLRSPQ